jgi:hypothetical protein
MVERRRRLNRYPQMHIRAERGQGRFPHCRSLEEHASGRRSDTSPRNALIGFFAIGIPAFSYAVFGRFTLRAPDARPSDLDTDDDDQKNNVAS